MRLRLTKQRSKDIYLTHRCSFCLPSLACNSSSLFLPPRNLAQRYYQPQVQSTHFRKIAQLLRESVNNNCLTLNEIDKNRNEKEFISQYYCFEDIVRSISGVVRNRVENDHPLPVHFCGQIFGVVSKNHRNCRKLRANLKTNKMAQKTQSYEEQLLQIHVSKRILKGIDTPTKQQEPNSTTIDLKLLSSNIDSMTKKMTFLSKIQPQLHKKSKNKSPNKAEKKKIIGLKKQIEGISVIKKQDKKKQKIKHNHHHQLRQEQETYGLEKVKSKQLGKKLGTISLRSLGRQALLSPLSLPQSPNPHLLLVSQKSGSNTKGRKYNSSRPRADQLTLTSFPSSPSIHKSLSLGLNHSLSRRGVASRRKR